MPPGSLMVVLARERKERRRQGRESINTIGRLVSGRGTTVKELALTVSAAAGFRGKIFFNANRYTGAKEKFLDAAKLRKKYKMEIPRDLAAGLRRTVAWYSRNYEAVKGRRKFANA